MQHYLEQLMQDIRAATASASDSFITHSDWRDWISDEEEDRIAPTRKLEEWTGIQKAALPPSDMLTPEQLHELLQALNTMLNAYNWCFVLQTTVPEKIQYEAIRDNFDQVAKVKQWHMGFFELCRPGTAHGKCALGEHCQCAFFAELFSHFTDEELTPEEERARYLAIEVSHIKKKYEDDWMKYYPYHLDPDYDDEYGNPYDYGVEDEEDEDNDDWWRR
jgi:hypothetical protein